MNQALSELIEKIQGIEDQIQSHEIKIQKKIAVFDLDNTLIIGDIGEAVFAQLKNEEAIQYLTIDHRPIPLTWSEYQDLIGKNKKKEAYQRLVIAMAGLPLDTLLKITEKTIHSRSRNIKIEGQSVPVPKPNSNMMTLIRFLETLAYHIGIISASNHYSVQLAATNLLHIHNSRAFGIKSRIRYHRKPGRQEKIPVLSAELERPIPLARGKVDVYSRSLGTSPPLITAGDSESDIYLLNLTHDKGLSIWLGKDREQFESIKKKIKNPSVLVFLPPK